MNQAINPLVSVLTASPTLALNSHAKKLALEGKKIYNLTAGEPNWSTPDYVSEKVAQHLHENKYTDTAGMLELREAIAAYVKEHYRCEWVEASNVVVTPGAKPALYTALLTILRPGDEAIVPAPYWVSYRQLIELCGATFVPVETTDSYGISPQAIADAITDRTKCLILNSPNNPTGAVYAKSDLEAVAEIVKDKSIYVLSDDIYMRLAYTETTPITMCRFDSERLIIVNGFSKSQALTGWRVGYVVAGDEVAGSISNLTSHVLGNTAVPSQYAAIAALEKGDHPPMLQNLLTQRKIAIEQLNSCPHIEFVEPSGAFYILIDVRKLTRSSVDWCRALLESAGVALVPGDDFGASGFVRMSFATDLDTLTEGIQAMKKFIEGSTT